MVLTT